MINIDYCSDLHFEFDADYYDYRDGYVDWDRVIESTFKNPQSDILCIAGDLFACNTNIAAMFNDFKAMLNSLDKFINCHYQRAFFVLGNHDYWYYDIDDVLMFWKNHLSDSIHLLNNDMVTLDQDTLLVGSTGWTEIDDADQRMHAQYWMNDYRYIRNDHGRLTADITSNFATATKKYIQRIAEENHNKKIVVVTHHAPSLNCQNINKTVPQAYFNNWDCLLENHSNITDWIYGHAHQNFDIVIGSCHTHCNARGYFPCESTSKDFKLQSIVV